MDRLTRWIALARHLPVHDLLDRIYHEADVLAAYQRRVPPPMWPGVCANLEAFLARITSYNVCYTKLLRMLAADTLEQEANAVVEQVHRALLSYNFV